MFYYTTQYCELVEYKPSNFYFLLSIGLIDDDDE